jgi:hypothetical protein
MSDQAHDAYGKAILRAVAGPAFVDWGPAVEVDYGTTSRARIDGVIGDTAVEVESRTSQQVRGAVLDLIMHSAPKKLLVLLPAHMSNAALCADQCRYALARFIAKDSFRVVVATGHGLNRRLEEDAALVKAGLSELGMSQTLST